jgi:hypothetical protein
MFSIEVVVFYDCQLAMLNGWLLRAHHRYLHMTSLAMMPDQRTVMVAYQVRGGLLL